MNGRPKVSEYQLHAHVDGRLDQEERRKVDARLAEDEDAAARVRAYQAQKQILHGEFDSVLAEPMPARLRDIRPAATGSPIWRAAVAAILLLAGGAGGWFANDWQRLPEPVLAQSLTGEALVAHRVYTKEVRHAVEVDASEETHLIAWLSKRLGAPLTAPDLSAQGYKLVGGRLLPTREGSAAHLMYETGAGRRLTLYVRTNRSGADTAFRFVQQEGTGAFYWLDGPLGFALLAEADRATLLPLARAVYNKLNP